MSWIASILMAPVPFWVGLAFWVGGSFAGYLLAALLASNPRDDSWHP